MAARWLVKSEPDVYSYADLTRDGRTVWDGVRNNAAALHLKAMKVGDEAFFYHSNEGKAVVGVARIVRESFPDASDPAGRFVAVELAPVRALPREVGLAEIKADPLLSKMEMIRQNRLSVSPVSEAEWARVLELAGG